MVCVTISAMVATEAMEVEAMEVRTHMVLVMEVMEAKVLVDVDLALAAMAKDMVVVDLEVMVLVDMDLVVTDSDMADVDMVVSDTKSGLWMICTRVPCKVVFVRLLKCNKNVLL